MKALVTMVAAYVVCHLLLMGLSVADGYLLYWLIPEVGLGIAILIGAILTITSIYIFTQVTQFVAGLPMPGELFQSDQDDDDTEQEDEEYEPPPPAKFRRRPRRRR